MPAPDQIAPEGTRWRLGPLGSFLAVTSGYVASSGPVLWLAGKGFLSKALAATVYAPVVWLSKQPIIGEPLFAYL